MVLPDISEDRFCVGIVELSETESIKQSLCFREAEDFRNPLCAIEFTDRNEILEARISEYCVDKYGAAFCLARILNEMTFFGVDEDFCRQNQEAELADLQEIEKRIQDGTEKCIPWEEVRRELGIEDDETPEEKEDRLEESWKQIEKRIFAFAREVMAALEREEE